MAYDIEQLDTAPTDAEIEDIGVLSDHLIGQAVPREVIQENVAEIVQNPSQFFLVARDAGHIIGMTLFTLKTIPHERTAYTDSMVVHPDYRRRGIGRQLWQHITDYADAHDIILQGATSPRRVEAWGLHQQAGFRQWDSRFIVRQPNTES